MPILRNLQSHAPLDMDRLWKLYTRSESLLPHGAAATATTDTTPAAGGTGREAYSQGHQQRQMFDGPLVASPETLPFSSAVVIPQTEAIPQHHHYYQQQQQQLQTQNYNHPLLLDPAISTQQQTLNLDFLDGLELARPLELWGSNPIDASLLWLANNSSNGSSTGSSTGNMSPAPAASAGDGGFSG
ncbi:hypothetical protein GGH99_000352, partial [Coemansia sp. RSA 1285]